MAPKPPTRIQPDHSAKNEIASFNNNSATSSASASASSGIVTTTTDDKKEDYVRADISAPPIDDDQGSAVMDDNNVASITKNSSTESIDDVQRSPTKDDNNSSGTIPVLKGNRAVWIDVVLGPTTRGGSNFVPVPTASRPAPICRVQGVNPPLLKLPPEILLLIADYLPKRDIHSYVLLSRSYPWSEIFISRLWRTLDLSVIYHKSKALTPYGRFRRFKIQSIDKPLPSRNGRSAGTGALARNGRFI
ncbi:hypothetical protein BGX24_012682 [Mortierella sp. AD032]|nr:hypothetical protein BGX24_012682 [Mortierella sp. AD032]